jgi:hypothetical protein
MFQRLRDARWSDAIERLLGAPLTLERAGRLEPALLDTAVGTGLDRLRTADKDSRPGFCAQ